MKTNRMKTINAASLTLDRPIVCSSAESANNPKLELDRIIELLKSGIELKDLNSKLGTNYSIEEIGKKVMTRGFGISRDLMSQRYFLKS